MTAEIALKAAGDLLAPWIVSTNEPEVNRLDVVVKSDNLLSSIAALSSARWGYLAGITGLDLGIEAGQLEVLYHFFAGAAVVTLRVSIPRDNATMPSICGVLPFAVFYERELHEMLGIEVVDLPVTDHLYLPDDWEEGVYPLRKDAALDV